MTNFLLVLSAPSGGGKTTLAKSLLTSRPDTAYSVSATTREPRQGEEHGKAYYFLTRLEFERRVAAGEADGLSNFVVMLDNHGQWRRFADEPETWIYWGAYLGTADQLLVAGPVAEVQDEIATVRNDAKERHGWIMDTYLIRRKL